MDRSTFLELLRQSRLLSEEQLARLSVRFGPDSLAQDMAAALVEDGSLTRYQARQVWAGNTRGLVLGQYRILDELGQGGFGQVFKALHTLMDRHVALKVISPELVEDSRARTWFRREVLACTELCHPNIVMAYDANEVDDVLFFVMEYVDGRTLDAFVKEHGPLPVELACEMMRQAALALQHAHEKGMVHRDIKPANMLIPRAAEQAAQAPEGGVSGGSGAPPVLIKVVDFGLARLHPTAKAGTVLLQSERSFLGTPDYVSPEQARSIHSVDIRSDLYSLGCTFYYALTANRPFRGQTVLEVIVQHLEQTPQPLEDSRPDVPAPVRQIVQRLMAKDPKERYPTPAELVAALTPWCSAVSTRARPADVPVTTSTTRMPLAVGGAPGGGTALVPQLAFWDGPVLRREETETAVSPAEPTPPPARILEAQSSPGARPAVSAGATVPLPGLAVEEDSGEWELASAPKEGGPSPDARLAPFTTGEEPAAVPFQASPEFRRCWRAWVAVVEAFAQGERVQVDEEGYRVVRHALLEQCRAGVGNNGARPAVLRRLESLVEPWLTPRVLAATDRPTLASLLRHCSQLNGELGVREAVSLWPWLGLLLLLGVGGGAGWYLHHASNWMAVVRPAVHWVRDLVGTRPLVCLGITVPAVLAAALYGLSRLLRAGAGGG